MSGILLINVWKCLATFFEGRQCRQKHQSGQVGIARLGPAAGNGNRLRLETPDQRLPAQMKWRAVKFSQKDIEEILLHL
ncbi:hypothetical protein OUZ56_020514 [Daphnia magna]|uniref:Uncharacterized protein n=1 Tax=Daphnia magna TaxID=35525 RepID=A0ABQ9ZEP2_9CRUS|nr:hypothetical protein OUZ56_020514 [Daphnia magna]